MHLLHLANLPALPASFLQAVVDAFEVRSMLDCACGDATWLGGSEVEGVFCQIRIPIAGWMPPPKNWSV